MKKLTLAILAFVSVLMFSGCAAPRPLKEGDPGVSVKTGTVVSFELVKPGQEQLTRVGAMYTNAIPGPLGLVTGIGLLAINAQAEKSYKKLVYQIEGNEKASDLRFPSDTKLIAEPGDVVKILESDKTVTVHNLSLLERQKAAASPMK